MNKEIFLTFDMDWAIDPVLENFYSLLENYDLVGTLNVTHYTEFVESWGGNRLEYGIHPNFNRIMLGEEQTTIDCILSDIKKIVPNAVTARSHSLANSSLINDFYDKYNIYYELNTLIPAYEGLSIHPYKLSNSINLLKLPFIYEDDVYLNLGQMKGAEFFLSDKFDAPRIFNFHPIHLFLNTDNVLRYTDSKQYLKDFSKIRKFVNTDARGIKDFFIELVTTARNMGWVFKKICEGTWE